MEAVQFLLSYVHYHFLAEEHAMVEAGYPKLEHHQRQHELMRKEVLDIRSAAIASEHPDQLLSRIHILFQDWFTLHIKEVDVAFAGYLRDLKVEEGERLPTAGNLVEQGKMDSEYEDIEERWNPHPELADGIDIDQ